MKKKTKTLILSIVVTLVLLLTFVVSYAAFVYQQTGSSNHQLVLGDIWMSYEEANGIDLSGAMPGDEYSEYFEFKINGKNTYTKQDIWYDVVLSQGEVPEGKTEDNRILDKYLNFKLVEVNDDNSETVIFTDKSYSDINGKRVYVSVIPKNTVSEYNKTYRLYMIINDKLTIGNTGDVVMNTEDYKEAFASVKVNVTGDFNEKELAYEDIYNVTDESCFTTRILAIPNYNMTEEEFNTCVTYITNLDWEWSEEETVEDFCKGTGTHDGSYTFAEALDGYNRFYEEQVLELEELNIISIVSSIIDYDTNCGSDVVIPKTIDGIKVGHIGTYTFNNVKSPSFSNKNLTSVVIPDTVIMIDDQAFENNLLTTLEIPNSVSYIGYGAFSSNQLKSVVIPNNVIVIGNRAFENNLLTNIEIPNSVIRIGGSAFENNKLQSVIFEENSKLEAIYANAFTNGNIITEVTIPDSVTYLSCWAFNDYVIINKSDNLTCTSPTPV